MYPRSEILGLRKGPDDEGKRHTREERFRPLREAAGRRLIREGYQERDISVAIHHRSRKLAL